ncbi:cilia- and flagella-associated protein 100-like [Plectropomus leopardus]|uniref:cilia- and flagella-associated protein 100-like n=1 Tax=Plectropomus leopardus TaxID=160734 RepID=UPI001C4BF3B1|nr:cilia- and flagella-associated protein 100-like [Plectropomus leopardus]
MSSPQPELEGGETGQSQLLTTVFVKEMEHQKEVLGKLFHVDKTTDNLAGEEVEECTAKLKTLHLNTNSALAKQTEGSPALRTSLIERVTVKRNTKRDIELKIAQQELCLMKSRSEVKKMDRAVVRKERDVEELEQNLEVETAVFKLISGRRDKKSMDARTVFETENKSKLEINSVIEKLTDEIGTTESEIAKLEDILNEHKRYQSILFKLSPPEWQEAQRAETLKAQVFFDGDTQDELIKEPDKSAVRRSVESSPCRVPPSTRESTLSSTHHDTLVTNSKLDGSRYEEKLKLYFSDPQQLLDLMMELTDQSLSLISNSSRGDEMVDELRQIIEASFKEMKEDDEKLTLQIDDMRDRIDTEKERAANLKKRVQLHNSLKKEDQDVMLDALGVKVTEVYRSCVSRWATNLSTLNKLASVENLMTSLLQYVENMPEEDLKTLRQIKDSQKRSRLLAEKLRLEMEKQKERQKKCMQRSLGEAKKISGRKLMPRCIPVEQKIRVNDEDIIPAEDELHAYLFSNEDVE